MPCDTEPEFSHENPRSGIWTIDQAFPANVDLAPYAPNAQGVIPLVIKPTPERLRKLLRNAWVGVQINNDADYIIDLWQATKPSEGDDEDEDIFQDTWDALADGVLANELFGSVGMPLGVRIPAEGSITAETALPLIGITLIGLGVAAVVSIVLGGVTLPAVAVAAGEVVEIIVATGASSSNIIPFAVLAAAA